MTLAVKQPNPSHVRLLVLTPAWRECSLEVRRKPSDWSPVAPAWRGYLFPALMGVVYFLFLIPH